MTAAAWLMLTAATWSYTHGRQSGWSASLARSPTGPRDLRVGSGVRGSYQRTGIGRALIERTRRECEPDARLLLTAAPAAVDYCAGLGFERHLGVDAARYGAAAGGGLSRRL